MKKYAKVINDETKLCETGLGSNNNFYASIGMTEMDVELAYNGSWYVAGYAPKKPALNRKEIAQIRRQLYIAQKDPITCQIQALKDEEQTEEVIAEIKALMQERSELVAKIKEENPYPTEE